MGTKCPVCLSEYENVFMHERRTFVLLSVPTGLLLLALASLLLLASCVNTWIKASRRALDTDAGLSLAISGIVLTVCFVGNVAILLTIAWRVHSNGGLKRIGQRWFRTERVVQVREPLPAPAVEV